MTKLCRRLASIKATYNVSSGYRRETGARAKDFLGVVCGRQSCTSPHMHPLPTPIPTNTTFAPVCHNNYIYMPPPLPSITWPCLTCWCSRYVFSPPSSRSPYQTSAKEKEKHATRNYQLSCRSIKTRPGARLDPNQRSSRVMTVSNPALEQIAAPWSANADPIQAAINKYTGTRASNCANHRQG